MRWEFALLAFFFLCWLAFPLIALAGYPFAGTLSIDLYALYGFAAALGWLLGHVVVARTRGRPGRERRRVVLLFLLSPGGLFYLIWALAPEAQRLAIPFVPLYASAVFAIFLLVPVSLRGFPGGGD